MGICSKSVPGQADQSQTGDPSAFRTAQLGLWAQASRVVLVLDVHASGSPSAEAMMVGPEPNGIVAVFPNRFEADSALEWLRIDGVEKRSVSVLGPAEAKAEQLPELDRGGHHRREIATYWARWGAMFGGVAAAGPIAIALAAATVGLGPLAGALAAALVVAGATTGVGALSAALVGVGIHEQHARAYEQALAAGKFLVVVHTDDPATLRTARGELLRLGAESVEVHGIPV